MRPILLVDNSNISQRAHFATFRPDQPVLSSSSGFPTNCISTYLNMLEGLMKRFDPSRLIIFMDGSSQRRRAMYAGYKQGRLEKSDVLKRQIPVVAQIIKDSGLEYCYHPDEEADDLIATVAAQLDGTAPVFIVSDDKDFSQCVTRGVHRLIPEKGDFWAMDEQGVMAKFGVPPAYVAHYLAIDGDKTDGIPGIEGLGPKKTAEILSGNPSLDQVVDRIAQKKKWSRDMAERAFLLSYELSKAIILPEVQILRGDSPGAALAKLDELECRRAQRNLSYLLSRTGGAAQPSLWDEVPRPSLSAPARTSRAPVARETQVELF